MNFDGKGISIEKRLISFILVSTFWLTTHVVPQVFYCFQGGESGRPGPKTKYDNDTILLIEKTIKRKKGKPFIYFLRVTF